MLKTPLHIHLSWALDIPICQPNISICSLTGITNVMCPQERCISPLPPGKSLPSTSSCLTQQHHQSLVPRTLVSSSTSLFHLLHLVMRLIHICLFLKPILFSHMYCHHLLLNCRHMESGLGPWLLVPTPQSQCPFCKESLVISPCCFKAFGDSPLLSTYYWTCL